MAKKKKDKAIGSVKLESKLELQTVSTGNRVAFGFDNTSEDLTLESSRLAMQIGELDLSTFDHGTHEITGKITVEVKVKKRKKK